MTPAAARIAVRRHARHRQEARRTANGIDVAIRILGEHAHGTVTAFSEAVAERAGVKPASVRNRLYGELTPQMREAALSVLGFSDTAALDAAEAQPDGARP